MSERFAWVTLLTDVDYLPGVRVLHASLRRTGSPYPYVVLVTDGVDAEARALLEADGCVLQPVQPLRPPSGLTAGYANARFAEVWTKLEVWRLTDYDRVVVLDADMLAVAPMDELFTLSLADGHIAACPACRCNPNRIASYPASWVPENCYYTHVERSTVDAPRGPGEVPLTYLNGGTLVLRPDEAEYDALMARLDAIEDLTAYPFAEQDFLNEHFAGRWVVLSYVYNALKTLPHQHPLMWQLDEVKNLHFIIDKPWNAPLDPSSRYYALEQRWWEVADDVGADPREVVASG